MLGLQTVAEHPAGPPPLRHADEGNMRDALTGLPDARFLRRAFASAVMWALRTGGSLSLALLRLENLRVLTQIGGAPLVDHAVAAAAQRLNFSFRASDVFARWSENEFAVLFPHTTVGGAIRATEKAMWAFHSEPFLDPGQQPFDVEWSAAVIAVEPAAPFMEAIGAADRLLDRAGAEGASLIHWSHGRLAPFRRRVAVVSSDPVCCRLAETLVLHPDDDFVHIGKLDHAVSQIEQALPTLVVLDLGAHPERGLEVLHQLRQTSASSGIPVVVTAGEGELLPRAFELGADDFLIRPFRSDEFHARAERLLRRNTRTGVLPPSQGRTTDPEA